MQKLIAYKCNLEERPEGTATLRLNTIRKNQKPYLVTRNIVFDGGMQKWEWDLDDVDQWIEDQRLEAEELRRLTTIDAEVERRDFSPQ